VSTIFRFVGFSDSVSARALLSRFDAAVAPSGDGTHLSDALSAFTEDEYPNAVRRIVVITDGEDDGSRANACDVATRLIGESIVVDAIVVSTDKPVKCELAAEAFAGLKARGRSSRAHLRGSPAGTRTRDPPGPGALHQLGVRGLKAVARAAVDDVRVFIRGARIPTAVRNATAVAPLHVTAVLRNIEDRGCDREREESTRGP
jgi:hypothetical protein